MRKIGITGGVGSGKSKVLMYLAEQENAVVYQADLIARKMQEPGEKCYEKVVRHFGSEILKEDGEIHRPALAKLVFEDSRKRNMLNQLVHPEVNQRIQDLMVREEIIGTQWFFVEAALLTEPFYRTILDEIWYIYAEEAVRRVRLKNARNYTDEKITCMMRSQPTEEEFDRCCDERIDNTGTFEDTKKQIDILLKNRMQE